MPARPLDPPGKRRTAWHPLFVRVLRALLPRDRYDVVPEFLLSAQPQRIDVVVVRKVLGAGPPEGLILRQLLDFLGPHTLIEFKGPTDSLDRQDFLWFRGYAAQYAAAQELYDRAQLHQIVVASRLGEPFRQLAEHHGARFQFLSPGVHQLSGLEHPYYVVEAGVAKDHVLQLFSPSFLQDPAALFSLLDDSERAIFIHVLGEVERFRQDREAQLRYVDFEEFTMSMQEFIDVVLKTLSKEEVLGHYSAEDRIKGLRPEERLKGLRPEERLKGLRPEERLKGLPPEDILKGLRPEERLKGLPPEDILKGLPPEEIQRLRNLLKQ